MIKGFGILKNDAMPLDYLVYKTLVLALAQCSGTAAPYGREQSETSNVKRLGSSFTALYMLRTDHIFRY